MACFNRTRWFRIGSPLSSHPEYEISQVLPSVDNAFTSAWLTTNLTAGSGYMGEDGRVGVCAVPPLITVTLNQSSLTITMAWVVSSLALIAFAYAFLLYFSSGPVAVLLQQVREARPLPSFQVTKRYYSSNRVVIAVMLFLVFSMIVGLAVVVFFPTIGFFAEKCPRQPGQADRPFCFYNYPSLTLQWSVFISSVQVAFTCGLLMYDIYKLLDQLRDPCSMLPPRTILSDKHAAAACAVCLRDAAAACSPTSPTEWKRVSLAAPGQQLSLLSRHLLITLKQEDEFNAHEKTAKQ